MTVKLLETFDYNTHKIQDFNDKVKNIQWGTFYFL